MLFCCLFTYKMFYVPSVFSCGRSLKIIYYFEPLFKLALFCVTKVTLFIDIFSILYRFFSTTFKICHQFCIIFTQKAYFL